MRFYSIPFDIAKLLGYECILPCLLGTAENTRRKRDDFCPQGAYNRGRLDTHADIISHGIYVLPALFFISLVILSQAQKSDCKSNICSRRHCPEAANIFGGKILYSSTKSFLNTYYVLSNFLRVASSAANKVDSLPALLEFIFK